MEDKLHCWQGLIQPTGTENNSEKREQVNEGAQRTITVCVYEI